MKVTKFLAPSLLVASAFVFVGCTSTPTNSNTNTTTTSNTNEDTDIVTTDDSQVLTIGEAITLQDESTLTATEVVNDSRCPEGEQCIQAGSVVIAFELEDSEGAKETVELAFPALGKDETDSAKLGAYTVTLVEVIPESESGKTIDEADYEIVVDVTE